MFEILSPPPGKVLRPTRTTTAPSASGGGNGGAGRIEATSNCGRLSGVAFGAPCVGGVGDCGFAAAAKYASGAPITKIVATLQRDGRRKMPLEFRMRRMRVSGRA